MSASTNGSDSTKIGEANSNSTGGFALSLRETLRLKAQAKLQHEQQRSVAHSPITTTRASTSSSTVPKPDGDQDQHDDYEPLGSLNLGRGKRQVKRPTTYSIDPLDDASRLRSHPNKLPKSVAQLAADPFKTRKSINSMLREQQRRMSRGTDADGFSKAEAIARSMEEERLGKMGIAYDGQVAKEVSTEVSSRAAHKGLFSSSKVTQSSHGSKKDEPALSVRALSPTIPSYLWSSQSEAGETDDEQDTEEIQLHQSRLAKSFAAVNAAEDQKTVALDILQRDARHRIDPSSKRPMAHVPFYESERTTRPTVETFCDVVNISTKSDLTHSTSLAATSDDEAWLSHLPSMILCNMIPPYLDLNPLQISRLIIRIAVTYILNTDAVQSIHLSSFLKTLFHPSSASSHHFELCTTVPQALSQIISLIPRILNRIGVREHVLEECFPDEVEVTSWVCPTLKRPTTASGKPKKCQRVYLTQAEREHILTNLAQVLEMVTRADANKGERVVGSNVTTLAGYVASMAIASAASTNFTLEAQIGGALNAIFSAAARESCECLNDLQKEVCRRTFTALDTDSIVVRARLVSVLSAKAQTTEMVQVQRFLAWLALTEHLTKPSDTIGVAAASPVEIEMIEDVPSSDPVMDGVVEAERFKRENVYWRRTPFRPFSLDLKMLVRAIDSSDPTSPFYIAPPWISSKSNKEASAGTRFDVVLSATQLVGFALGELAIHLCTFSSPIIPTTEPSTCDHTKGKPLPATTTTTTTTAAAADVTTNKVKGTKALRLALTPYRTFLPKLDSSRIIMVRNIIHQLNNVNSRIRDNRGDVILRSLVKDALQRTWHLLESCLRMYSKVDDVIW